MAKLSQQAKSKTIQFNAIVAAVVGILRAYNVEIPAEVATGVLAIGNYILRLVTKQPLEEK